MLTPTITNSLFMRTSAFYGITNFSTATSKSERNEKLVTKIYGKLDQFDRRAVTLNGAVCPQIMYIDHNGYLQVMTKPTQASKPAPSFASIIIGSRSDDFNSCIPFAFQAMATSSTYIGITTLEAAQAHGWAISPTCPVITEGPDDDTPPEADRIGMNFENEAKKPVIVEVPYIAPVPFGFTFPTNIDVSTDFDIDNKNDYKPLADWWKIMTHSYKYAKGKSLSEIGNGLFDPTVIDMSAFSTCKKASELGIPDEILDPIGPMGSDVVSIISGYKHQICCEILGNDPITQLSPAQASPNQPPTNNGPGLPIPDPVKNLQAALKAAVRTTTEKEKDEEHRESMAQYSIFFGRTKITNDSETFIPAKLSKEFQKFLGTTKVSKAIGRLQEILSGYEASIANSDKTLDNNCHFEIDMIDSFMVTQLQHGNWASKSIILDPDSPETLLSILHFAPCNQNSVNYQKMQSSNLQVLYQEQVGEDKSKIGNKRTKLFTGLTIESFSDIEKMIATFLGFIRAAVQIENENELPDLMINIMTMATLFRKEEAKAFKHCCTVLPGVVFMLSQEIQNIVAAFVTESKKLEYKNRIIEDRPVPVEIFDNPNRCGKVFIQKVRDAFYTGNISKYNIIVSTYAKLFKQCQDPTPPVREIQINPPRGTREDPRHRDTNCHCDNTRQRTTPRRDDGANPPTDTSGIIEWSNAGNPLCHHVFFPTPAIVTKRHHRAQAHSSMDALVATAIDATSSISTNQARSQRTCVLNSTNGLNQSKV